ncbi:MAG: diguanylate cyclase [Pelotomaculum sp.]|nr:diguanylate cyclase [Pelotomaculum sp.]
MESGFAELAVLYEISTWEFPGSEEKLFRELVDKASRLFGSRRVVLIRNCTGGRKCYSWGLGNLAPVNCQDYIEQRRTRPDVYIRELGENGSLGSIYLEKRKGFKPCELRLLDILAKRAGELLRLYYREFQLQYISTHDVLTGLYNRSYFEEELRRLEKSDSYPVSIILCDLDNLKLVNDALGHERGDELLRCAAGAISQAVKEKGVAARIGGDEFVVLLPRTSRIEAEEIAQKIIEAVEEANTKNPDLLFRLSIGMATADGAGCSLWDLCKEADDMMYRDKLARGKNYRGAVIQVLKAALAAKDFVAEGHTERVKQFACLLGEAAGLSWAEMDSLQLLADIHDIGKLGVPEHILLKKGPLSSREWEEIKRHPEIGYRIALSSPELAPLAELIRQHHEWWNGEGYPQGLRGEQIHILSRIVAIADAYDAMTSSRPYRKAFSSEEALAEIKRAAGTQFDPILAKTFLQVVERSRGKALSKST